MENTDPRYVKSRLKLRAAFLEIAHDSPEQLTVSAVCEKTGIDRATFYRHFDALDDLVADALSDLANQADAQWRATSTGSGNQFEESANIIHRYMRHIEDNWKLYQWALGQTGSIKTVHALLQRSAFSAAAELEKLRPDLPEAERALRSAFAAGGMVGVYIHWLSTDSPAYTSEQLAPRVLQIAQQQFDPVLA